VSRISNPRTVRQADGLGVAHGLPVGNRRYSRLETCATVPGQDTRTRPATSAMLSGGRGRSPARIAVFGWG
jgi:hypothetical protein